MRVAKALIGIIIIAIIVVGCATSPELAPNKSGIEETQSRQTEPISYEVIKTYTVEVIVGTKPGGITPMYLVDLRNKACVEIKNTANMAGLFSVDFFFSEEYFGHDLIYLKAGETGVATYMPLHTYEDFKSGLSDKEFNEKTADWRYEITPIALNP